MSLVVFLIAYVLRRRLDRNDHWCGDAFWRSWFHRWGRVAAGREASLWPGLLVIGLPALVLAGVEVFTVGEGMRWALYPLELLLLLMLLGAPGWRAVLRTYSDAWQRGDMQAAWHHIQERLPAAERGAALSPEAMHLSVSRALMISVFERFFLVVFWYAVGGIALAFLARGLVALAGQWPQMAARARFRKLAQVVEWVPARLLSCTFGIAGDLAGWGREIRSVFPGVGKATPDVLMISANGSLTGYALDPARFAELHPEEWPAFGGRSLSAIRDLLNRSMLVWICAFALLVIAGIL
ncbi:regulatory signaling modulator protein AmpE [Marinobacter daepoensis]|uniref:Regulatory signaling modulator protein AmpE n=1 Tax=Marinobacter daepoensis TaxID=262077 RepID=A0ABS3BLU4_9GAMM|nr:regulatory signaling modulator protein AmpE [Marinobacter daepoensis]MBN7771717.1 regulatory signaling modulator protein AmpE [Marinobacter daepoensis]MBY6080895.1 regulatory signaling modulator protein AmpE [Marinobacter daepoensis]